MARTSAWIWPPIDSVAFAFISDTGVRYEVEQHMTVTGRDEVARVCFYL